MSAPEQCGDGGGVSGSGQEAEADGEPPHERLPPPDGSQASEQGLMAQEEGLPPPAKHPRLDDDEVALNWEASTTAAGSEEGRQNHASSFTALTGEIKTEFNCFFVFFASKLLFPGTTAMLALPEKLWTIRS